MYKPHFFFIILFLCKNLFYENSTLSYKIDKNGINQKSYHQKDFSLYQIFVHEDNNLSSTVFKTYFKIIINQLR